MTAIHSEESVASTMARRQHAGAPEGECGNCREGHGHPKNCLNPKACIHGYARARSRRWSEDNPDFGTGRQGGAQ